LELLWSLVLGTWCFGARRIPPKTAKNLSLSKNLRTGTVFHTVKKQIPIRRNRRASDLMVPRCFRWHNSSGNLHIPSSKLPPSVADMTLRKDATVQLLRRTGQRSSKPQTSTHGHGWPPHRSGLGLELEIWSFSGAWCLGLGALVRAAFHRKQRGTDLIYPRSKS